MRRIEMQDRKNTFYRQLLVLVIPIAFQQFMLAMVSVSDAIMLGRLSQDAMSASSQAGQVQFIFNLFVNSMTAGGSVLVAQYWGKRDKKTVEKVLGLVWKISVPISLVFTLATLFVPNQIMGLLTSEAIIRSFGAEYLRAVSLSYLFCGISQMYLCVMKNTGYAARSAMISSVCVVINVVLNAILIFGLLGNPALGIKGAAYATVITRLIEMVWALSYMRFGDSIKLNWSYLFHTERILFHDFRVLATPVLLNAVVWGIGFTMQSVIMGHMGSDAVAANSIALISKNLITCFASGIANGGAILLGNEMGAGHLDTAREYGDRLMRIAVINGIITGVGLIAISPVIVHVSWLTDLAAHYLQIMFFMCGYYMFGKSLTAVTNAGLFCAGGDSRFGFICDTITMWGFIVPVGLLAAFVLHLPVLWVYFLITLDETVKLPAFWRHYKKYQWVRNITR